MPIEYLEDSTEPLISGMVKPQPTINKYEMPEEIEREIRETPYRFGYGGFSKAVYYRTYSQLKENGKKEDYPDTIIRVVKGIVSILKDHKIKNCLEYDEAKWNNMALRFGKAMMKMHFLPPGRGLWISGTNFAYTRGSAAFNNCGFCSLDEGLVKAACWTMDSLMCGCGIGFSSESNSKEFDLLKIPGCIECSYVKTKEGFGDCKCNKKVYKIHDSREGWVKSLNLLLESYFTGEVVIFDYSELRLEGVPIKGFGGESSGPEPLRVLHERIRIFMECYIKCRDSQKEKRDEITNMIISHIAIYPHDNKIERGSLLYALSQLIFGFESAPTTDDDKVKFLLDKIDEFILTRIVDNDTIQHVINKFRDSINDTILNELKSYERTTYILGKITNHISNDRSTFLADRMVDSFFKRMIHHLMESSEIMNRKTYSKTRLICDIFNSIGICIVAGNVRRSSEIALNNVNDPDFKDLKDFNLNPERGIIGWMSNNTATFDKTEDFDELPNVAKRILNNGEPGILNRLNIKRYGRYGKDANNTSSIGREGEEDKGTGLNPCVTGDTLILTSNGLIPVKNLIGKKFIAIVDGNEYPSTDAGFWSSGTKPIVKVTLQNGMSVKLTANHKILTTNGWKSSTDFAFGDKVILSNNTNYSIDEYEDYVMRSILPYIEKFSFNSIYRAEYEILVNQQIRLAAIGIISEIVEEYDEENNIKLGYYLSLPNDINSFLNGNETPIQNFSFSVSKIEQLEPEEVYDCSIPGPNCFSGNGIILANCGEIILESFEYCNLAEIFPTRCETQEDLMEATFLATTYASIVSLLPTHWTCSNKIIAKNRRIGVSISGITDEVKKTSVTRFIKNCRAMYRLVRKTNSELAAENGVPESIRVTTVKPSGTISQLVGVPSGMHHNEFEYCIRRMRVGNTSKLCDILKSAGYEWEYDKSAGEGTLVFSFPLHQGDGRTAEDVSPWEQASLLAMMQREWADNSVSCTITVKPDTHGDELEHLLAQYAPVIKCLSVLPVTPMGVYEQMPYEKISKEKYEEMLSRVKVIDTTELDDHATGTRGCDGDTCDLQAYKLSVNGK